MVNDQTLNTLKEALASPPPAASPHATESEQVKAWAEWLGWPVVNLSGKGLQTDRLKAVPRDVLEDLQAVPWQFPSGESGWVVGTPGSLEDRERICRRLGGRLVGLAPASQIRQVIETWGSASSTLATLTESLGVETLPDLADEQLQAPAGLEDRPIVRLVDGLLATAIRMGASDIHLEPTERHLHLKYRVDGVLRPAMDPLDKRFQAPVLSRIKVLAELNLAEQRVPQDGRFKLRAQGRPVDFRVSVLPSVYGEAVVIRILDRHTVKLDLNDMGFDSTVLARFRELFQRPHGMILVTGPTGSGKTTTLYGVIREIATGRDKIVTVEDPVEYLLPGIIQVPVNEQKNLTFATGLRSILRHDPDTILVGEIRDAETAHIAIQSALTGHRVFSTIHATSVVEVFGRLMAMGVRPYEFVTSLNAVLAQRLIRRTCAACKGSVGQKESCPTCAGTRYKGREAVYELMPMTDPLKTLLIDGKSFLDVRRQARQEGMKTLREAGKLKWQQGLTTEEELTRVMGGEET